MPRWSRGSVGAHDTWRWAAHRRPPVVCRSAGQRNRACAVCPQLASRRRIVRSRCVAARPIFTVSPGTLCRRVVQNPILSLSVTRPERRLLGGPGTSVRSSRAYFATGRSAGRRPDRACGNCYQLPQSCPERSGQAVEIGDAGGDNAVLRQGRPSTTDGTRFHDESLTGIDRIYTLMQEAHLSPHFLFPKSPAGPKLKEREFL